MGQQEPDGGGHGGEDGRGRRVTRRCEAHPEHVDGGHDREEAEDPLRRPDVGHDIGAVENQPRHQRDGKHDKADRRHDEQCSREPRRPECERVRRDDARRHHEREVAGVKIPDRRGRTTQRSRPRDVGVNGNDQTALLRKVVNFTSRPCSSWPRPEVRRCGVGALGGAPGRHPRAARSARPSSGPRPVGGEVGVTSLEYEAYEESAEARLAEVGETVRRRWSEVERVAVIHRKNTLIVGETAVVVVVAAPDRAEAFEAARLCVDTVKASAPTWKRETWTGSSDWSVFDHLILDVPGTDAS